MNKKLLNAFSAAVVAIALLPGCKEQKKENEEASKFSNGSASKVS